MALMAPMTPEEQVRLMQAPASPSFAMVQHPMHAMIAPLGPPPPEIDPATAMGMSPEQPSMPQAKQPKVTTMSPLERYEEKQGGRLMSDMQRDENPYGSANNHPGFFGKLLHGLSVATGGPNRRAMEEAGLAKGLNTNENELSKRGLEGAQGEQATANAGHLNAETPEVAPDAASTRAYQGAETAHTQAETANLQNPQDTNPDMATYRSLVKMGMAPREALLEIERDKALALKPQGMEKGSVVGPNGKPIEANYHADTGKWTDTTGKEIINPVPYEKPNQAGMVTVIAPDPNTPGGGIVQRLGAGAHLAPGSQTMAGVNSMNTPTTNQRTAAGRADTVLQMVPEVISRLDRMKGKIGPEMGRWNDFMQGKVGASNADFAALRSDLLMMSSAVALAHAQGRLPENLREEFDHAINAPQQTAENLEATINAMVPWLQKVQQQGERPGAQQASPTATDEPKVLKFNQQTGRLE